MKTLLSYLLFLNIFCLNLAYSYSSELSDEINSKSKKIFSFPVNIMGNNALILTAEAPVGFKPGEDLDKMIEAGLIEYIPVKEDINAWTEIITFKPIIGKQFSADSFVEAIEKSIKQKSADFAIIKKNKTHTKDYDTAEAFVTYTVNNQQELIWLYGASGPADTATVQYTIRVPDQTKREKLSPYIDKIIAFKNKNIKITEGKRAEKDIVIP